MISCARHHFRISLSNQLETTMKSITPDQTTGKAIDAQSSRTLATTEEARQFFETAKARLKRIGQWHELSGHISATFELADPSGKPVDREPVIGDYFKIDIPGPGGKAGQGYDWAKVEAVKSEGSGDHESFGIRVRPSQNPNTPSTDTAHFYSPESTSTFVVRRSGNTVEAAVYDRNIKPNTDASYTIDQIRDAVIGATGLLGFSKIQWQRLTDGLID
jgi:hypothetical protein